MADLVARHDRGQLQNYDPERHRLTNAALDFGIEEAKRIKDWPTLERAVDEKIAEQQKFVVWWNAAVRRAGQPKKEFAKNAANSLTEKEATKLTGMPHQRVSDILNRLAKPDKYRERLLGAGYHAAMLEAGNVRGTQGTGDNEWYTPAEYIDLARLVLGEIDLDPASTPLANERVKATQIFTEAENGLMQDWVGNIWLNPPYAQPAIQHFADKMVAELEAGHVTAAIVLTHNYTDTAWFQQLAHAASAICFTRGRIRFEAPNGDQAAPTQGQAFFYFGSDVGPFAVVFADVGFVVNVVPAPV